jgi:hypothetical protein
MGKDEDGSAAGIYNETCIYGNPKWFTFETGFHLTAY